ncbi:MAG: tetratricopeptide repeat protein [Ferruginibacter sp.]
MKSLRVFIVLVFCSKLIFAQQTNTASSGNTYALVIGIAKYLDPDIPQLQFSNQDAEVFAEFLQSKAGGYVPKENIRLLVDSFATTGSVYNAIYWLKNSCKKNDKVYIYFSGHGDLENITMYKNGFLICYDSPQFNYVRLALSIDYLNDMANTLSVENEANVILITDACHSGKLTDKRFKGNFLAAEQLRKVKSKEIRITSSSADELSNEKADWGGGRGVFSYYLVNGLKGLAAKKNSDQITLDDIKNYLDSSLKNDMVLMQDSTKQTPVVKGNGSFVLSQVDTEALLTAKKEITQDTILQRASIMQTVLQEESTPEQSFFDFLRQLKLEEITDEFRLNEIPAAEISLVFIDSLITRAWFPYKDKLTALKNKLSTDKEALTEFNNRLAIEFDNAGQRVITQYLKGDAAELERRKYYNAGNNGYDVYPRMFQVALNLTSTDNLYYRTNLTVKLHYFTGVIARLKIPLTKKSKQSALINEAFAEQNKALELEQYAAYIYNELGILYSYKNNLAEAEKYFKIAAERAPNWAIPFSNLAELYTGKNQLDKASLYIDTAKILQPGFQDIYNGYGLIYEKNKKLLQAEEAFHKSIKLNSLNYLPFERLGFLYINTNQYAVADSFLFEAADRKKGYQYIEMGSPRQIRFAKPLVIEGITTTTDPTWISNKDMVGHFALGYEALRDQDLQRAEREFRKVIALDKSSPLAYHYLGRTLFEQKKWQEGELILNLAIRNHLPYDTWKDYADSVLLLPAMGYMFDPSTGSCFEAGYYNREEDYLMLARLYERWGHFDKSETWYRKFIEADSAKIDGYLNLITLYENTGRFSEAEALLNNYYVKYGRGMPEILNFYKRVTQRFPDNGEWNLKAGLFQYGFAEKEPQRFWDDTKMIDPFSGEVSYVYPQKPEIKIPGPILPPLIPYGTVIPVVQVKVKLKPFTEGIYYLKSALQTLNTDEKSLADINTKIGNLYVWQGLPDSAVYFYTSSLSLNPDDAGTRNKLIGIYSASYRFSEALAQLDSLSNRQELNFEKKLILADYKLRDGQISEAEKLLGEAEQITPVTSTALTGLKAELERKKGNFKQAIDIYTGIYESNKKDSMAIYNMARLNALLGNKKEAWKWLKLAWNEGFNYTYVLIYDPAFSSIRKDPSWNAAIKAMKVNQYNSDFAKWDEMYAGLTENPASTFQ